MEIELPKEKIKASRINPRTMVLFGKEKSGKSTILSGLKDCLIIDVEKSTDFLDALKFDVITKAEEEKTLPVIILKKLITKIKNANEKKGDYIYKYIALDTVSALEDIVLPYAKKLYQNTPQGRNYIGDDITTLPNGSGYRWSRMALFEIINDLESICDTLIILGHVKDKMIELKGEEINERGLDLIGKSSSILCSKVDAIGYVYRKENKTIINFRPSESLIVGGRSKHLIGKEIIVAESNENDEIKVDWSKIFIQNN